MVASAFACGRAFPGAIIQRIHTTLQEEPGLSRCGLAQRVCEWLGWKGPNGTFRHMSCRVALLKLHRQGIIPLPPPRRQVRFAGQSDPRGRCRRSPP